MKKQEFKRGAGILLPILSLPSPYGVGTMGKAAYEWIDFLKQADQKYWQVLPLGPTGYGDSPYQAYSVFAGNPYFIDLDMLIEEGLLERWEVEQVYWGDQENAVYYDLQYQNRFTVLRKAFDRAKAKGILTSEAFEAFAQESDYWLKDYALFMAVKLHFQSKCWLDWDEDIKFRRQNAIERFELLLADDIQFWSFIQFEFYVQWAKLKAYAAEKEIELIGDIPIYCAPDSCDVWSHPGLFLLQEENLLPKFIAGVPPDAFSETGQLWGNPLYDWNAMEENRFEWWRQRVLTSAKLYDALRIDHFIGITRFYAVPYGAETSVDGVFMDGPCEKLTDVINEASGDMKIIAEDLGIVTEKVKELLASNDYPGMKVIAFALDGDPSNSHLPHNMESSNCIVYGGTHDNETLAGQFLVKADHELDYLYRLTGSRDRGKIVENLFRLAYGSVAKVAIFQAQDVLHLDNSARMNYPSTMGNNWRWRLRKGQMGHEQAQWLKNMVSLYHRY